MLTNRSTPINAGKAFIGELKRYSSKGNILWQKVKNQKLQKC